MDTLFTILHVAAAVFIVGPMAILPQTAMRAVRSGQGAQVKTLATSTTILTWLSLLVAVLGFGVMGMSDPKYHVSFSDLWIWLSVVLYVIAFVISMFVVVPSMRKAAAALGAGTGAATDAAAAASSPARAGYPAIAAGSGITALLLLAVVVLMVWKP